MIVYLKNKHLIKNYWRLLYGGDGSVVRRSLSTPVITAIWTCFWITRFPYIDLPDGDMFTDMKYALEHHRIATSYAGSLFSLVIGFVVAFRSAYALRRYTTACQQIAKMHTSWGNAFLLIVNFFSVTIAEAEHQIELNYPKVPKEAVEKRLKRIEKAHEDLCRWFSLMGVFAQRGLNACPLEKFDDLDIVSIPFANFHLTGVIEDDEKIRHCVPRHVRETMKLELMKHALSQAALAPEVSSTASPNADASASTTETSRDPNALVPGIRAKEIKDNPEARPKRASTFPAPAITHLETEKSVSSMASQNRRNFAKDRRLANKSSSSNLSLLTVPANFAKGAEVSKMCAENNIPEIRKRKQEGHGIGRALDCVTSLNQAHPVMRVMLVENTPDNKKKSNKMHYLGEATKQEKMILDKAVCPVEILCRWITEEISMLCLHGDILAHGAISSRTISELSRGIRAFKMGLRLTNVPFPFNFAQVVSCMLYSFCALFPILMGRMSPGWGVFVTMATLMGFVSMNEISKDLEEPYGEDDNDVCLVAMHHDYVMGLYECLYRKFLPHSPQDDYKFKYAKEENSKKVSWPVVEGRI